MKEKNRSKIKCVLCELHEKVKDDGMCESNATMEIPKYSKGVLMIQNDTIEIIFSIQKCPLCGKDVN